jgi:hypothetical protein
MELRAILNANAVRFVRDAEQPRIFLPAVARAIKERYNFVKYPTTIEEFVPGEFLEFQYGNFFDDAIINKLTIYQGGLAVESPVFSDRLDSFLDDVLSSLAEFGISTAEASISSLYGSTLEVIMRPGFSTWLKQLEPVVESVRAAIEEAIPVSSYQLGGFSLVGEGSDAVKPPRFIFERRADQPLDANVYFSQGPLTAERHLALLTKLEKLF